MRSFFPACCLALLCAAAFAAVGDENWGEEIVLLPPELDVEISDFVDDDKDGGADGTGRFWALHDQTQYRANHLATWEGGSGVRQPFCRTALTKRRCWMVRTDR